MSLPVIHSAISLIIHIPVLYLLLRFTDLNADALVICNCLFPAVVCVLNWISIKKHINYKQEVKKTFIIPAVCSVIMGVCAALIYRLFSFTGNTVACAVSVMSAIVIYFFLLIRLGGLTKDELLAMPKGKMLVRVFTKMRLLNK